MCGYVLMHNEAQLGRCIAGQRRVDADNLLMSPCSVVTTTALRPGDRLRLQDVANDSTDDAGYVLVPATPAETAASNFWGVIKLADFD